MDGTLSFSALVALIFVALAFDFLNGLHDAANSIATVVSTRVLRPQYAVIWAAFFNFIAFLFFGLHVAQTVGTGIVAAEVVDAAVIDHCNPVRHAIGLIHVVCRKKNGNVLGTIQILDVAPKLVPALRIKA